MSNSIIEISCAEAWQQISEMVDGTIAPELRTRMQLHLRHCTHCQAVLDGTRNVVRLLGDHEVFDMPAGFSERLFQRLSRDFHQPPDPGSPRSPRRHA